MAALFPAFLKVEGRRCVVVGAGRIAEQKLEGLLAAGASIRVIAPTASARIRELAQAGRIELAERVFAAADLKDAFLVIAATGHASVNEQVFREAERRGILCNAVDDPERCHFYYPAVVNRGDLQIAISTAGKSPALAQRIRLELEKQFAPDFGQWLAWLGRVRQLYFARNLDASTRVSALHRIASRRVYERFTNRRAERGGVHHG